VDDSTTVLVGGKLPGSKVYEVRIDCEDLPLYESVQCSVTARERIAYVRCHRPRSDSYEFLHRMILNAPKGVTVDHVNHDGLDNRRANLRVATLQQNCWNQRPSKSSTTGFRGVRRNSGQRRKRIWLARISDHDGKVINLGHHDTPKAAARAYDRAAREMYGEFAYLNFPDEIRHMDTHASVTPPTPPDSANDRQSAP
jgi:hypothetical protein